MKTPYRYLIGIAAGLAAGFFIKTGGSASAAVDTAAELSMRIGRYLVMPLMFFALPVAVTRLRRMGKLGALLGRSALYAVISAAVLTVAGTLVVWLVDFGRIAVIPGTPPDLQVTGLRMIMEETLDMNLFRVLVGSSAFILPVLLPAFLLGWHLHFDREIAEPAFNLFDSLSRLVYRANRYLLVIMPALLAVFTVQVVMRSRQVVDFSRFFPLIGILAIVSATLVGGVFPLILYLAAGRKSPWKTLAGLTGSLLGAFFSGSPLFNYGNFTRHLRENLAVPRHTAALAAPLYLMFARAGTGLVTTVCMLTVIRSYSSLEITLFQAAWTALFSFLISFALPATPDGGLTAALIIIGGLYGRGLDDGWLILAPVLPILAMFTVLLDTATAALLLLLANRNTGLETGELTPALRF